MPPSAAADRRCVHATPLIGIPAVGLWSLDGRPQMRGFREVPGGRKGGDVVDSTKCLSTSHKGDGVTSLPIGRKRRGMRAANEGCTSAM